MQTGRPFPLTPDQQEQVFQLAVALLGDLVRCDTTNPPGNEIVAAEYLARRFRTEGMEPEVIEPAPGRGNVVVRLTAGAGAHEEPARALLLLSHLDVVPAEPERWQVSPFSGEVRDGFIWGRGTLDTKGLTAVEAAVLIWAKRLGIPLQRDIVLAATANEESGGGWGAKWLAENRLDLIAASAAINEGGGVGLDLAGRLAYTVQTAEKAPCPVTVKAEGRPGHASVPTDDNAVVRLSRALVAIGSRRLPIHVTDTYRQFVETLAKSLGGVVGQMAGALLNPSMVDAIIDKMAGDAVKAGAMRAMVRNTATPTVVQAGYKINVIPGEATAQLDCRLLPGFGHTEVLAELNTVLREAGLDGTVKLDAAPLAAPSTESSFDHPIVAHIRAAMETHAPGSPIVPLLVSGATDGRHLRPKGIPTYGFSPMLPTEDYTSAHGHNERISLATVRFGTTVLWDVVTSYCTA